LTLARGRKIAPKAVAIDAVLSEMAPRLRRLLGPSVVLRLSLPPGTWPVRVDLSGLEEVLSTLTVNAAEAMPRGGTLCISVRNERLETSPGAPGAEQRPGDYVAIDVSDTGVGIDEAMLGSVFEPFSTTQGRSWASGLSLATAHGIVARAGGRLSVASEPGAGSTFTALLPRASLPRSALPGQPVAGSDVPAGDRAARLVLVVDDNAIVRQTAALSLSRSGYRVVQCTNGPSAVDELENLGEPVDLLLTDVAMPGMRGDTLADLLRSRQPQLRVLYMSGRTDPVAAKGRGPPHPHTTVHKPFTPAELVRRVRESLDE
jgi:CheY-like chemotaxis protein